MRYLRFEGIVNPLFGHSLGEGNQHQSGKDAQGSRTHDDEAPEPVPPDVLPGNAE
jgi:hypothetical protein